MITAAMKAAIKQYSIAVTPRLSNGSAGNVRKSLSTVRCPLPTGTDDQSASFIFLFYVCLFNENLIPLIFLQASFADGATSDDSAMQLYCSAHTSLSYWVGPPRQETARTAAR
jgi:hypothetical protein